MRSDIAISVKNLTKTYRVFGHPGDRIKQALTLGQVHFHQKFTALQGVSFEIKKGETVGIIGRNGSGKSTLLQLICGVLKPTLGTVMVNGRVSALLELGAGFNPEFTGRENVYFQGAVMGMTKEVMDQRFDDIAAFADIGEFIDQPVRTYSSGMFVRLAFAVAVHVEPDVLVIDEALSVGDVIFQHKSKKRVREMIDFGTSLLMVSHDRNTVTSTCNRCIFLDGGRMEMDSLPSDVFDYYHAKAAAKSGDHISLNQLDSGRAQVISGTGEAHVEHIRLLDSNNQEIGSVEVGAPVVLEFVVRAYQPIPRLVLGFTIRDSFGQQIYGTNTNSFGKTLIDVPVGGGGVFRFSFRASMGTGSYSVSTALVSTNDRFANNYECRELAFFFEVQNVSHSPFGGSVWLNADLVVQA